MKSIELNEQAMQEVEGSNGVPAPKLVNPFYLRLIKRQKPGKVQTMRYPSDSDTVSYPIRKR